MHPSLPAFKPMRMALEEVHQAAGRGWRLLPLVARGKRPLIKQWQRLATSDLVQVEVWRKQFPGCNWGMATGPDSGVFAIDLDGEAGLAWLKTRIDAGDELPETRSTRTGGGLHIFFAWPPGLNIRNSTSKLANGVDVRGAGGYVVIPPSVHPNGTQYAVVDDSCPVSPAQPWLLDLLCETAAATVTARTAVPQFEIIPEGRRNSKLASIGGYHRRKGCDQAEIETILQNVNARRCVPPLPTAEVSEIAASMAQYPISGPDPLESAWDAIQGAGPTSGFAGFIELADALQRSREGLDVALPLERIAELFGVHFTSVQQWRKKAVAAGLLEPVGQYVAHRKAGTYRVLLPDSRETSRETKTLTTLTTGLVRESEAPLVREDSRPIVRVVADSKSAATSFDFGFNAHTFCAPRIGPGLNSRNESDAIPNDSSLRPKAN